MGILLRLVLGRRVKDEPLFDFHRDPRERPIYNVAEAAAYVGVPRGTLRHWIKSPPGGRALIEADNSKLSFYNLLEAHVLRVVLSRDAWLNRVRRGVEKLRERDPRNRHPLLSKELRTAGGYRDLFVETVAGQVENVSRGGQMEFRALLKQHLQRIDFDSTGPYRLRPFKFSHISLDHRVLGGKPSVLDTRISIDVLVSRHKGGDNIEALARDYQIDRASIREALRYASKAA